MRLLIDARERGIAVPKEMLDAGTQYLQQLAANERLGTLDQLRQRAYAGYLLTRQGNVTTNSLAAVQKRLQDAFPNDWKSDLAAGWLAASYQLLKQDKKKLAVKARYHDKLPQDIALCSVINRDVIVCDDVGTNWVFVSPLR